MFREARSCSLRRAAVPEHEIVPASASFPPLLKLTPESRPIMTLAAAAQHLPDPVIHALRSAKNTAASAQRAALRPIQRRQLRTAVRELQALAPELPSRELVSRLIRAWNNRAADEPGYLLSVIEHAREADGPILECGSGLTTIALAVYSKQTVVSLENDPKWFKTLATDLHYLGLASNGLVLTSAESLRGFPVVHGDARNSRTYRPGRLRRASIAGEAGGPNWSDATSRRSASAWRGGSG